MSAPGSVTHWLEQLKAGDRAAAQPLWERYFQRMVELARQHLRSAPRRLADEEDVALGAFDSFFRGAQRGHFPQLADRNDLWRLLVVITARTASDLKRRERAQKRGGLRLPLANQADLAQVVGTEPSPEFAAQVAEECQRLLARLGDGELRSIALWKMEGYSNDEIATKIGCVARTVERRLAVIRSLWSVAPEEDAS
jgi:DNA-directed RNA polymerase specialized sigma24 family protein